MGSKVLVLYSLSLVLAIIRLHLSPFLVTCSSISSPSHSNNNSSSISSVLCHPEESSALLGFKNSMTIVNSNPYINIRSWKKGTDCCGWDGVTCHPTSHHVVDLYLLSSGLLGALDSNNTLFQLRHLRSLSLSNNDFSQSTISPMFGSSFPHLEELDLSYSNFSGEVPVEISQLSNLQVLSLLPDSNGGGLVITMKMSTFYNIISNMTKLSDLFLGGVNIDSTFPPSLANLSSLEVLNLGECNLRGQLPANVLNFPLLKEIYLGGNQGINANFQLSNWSTSLERIDLSNVNFSAQLPQSSPVQSQLTTLYLSGGGFHGHIPDWVWIISTGSNASLMGLDLSDNKFSGNINLNDNYSNLSNLDSLGFLDLSHNYLTGSFTKLPWNNLGILDLSYNMFDGPLPVPPLEIFRFSASNNNFTGPLPSSLCNLTSLQILDLSNNKLKDELPHCLVNLSNNLTVLNLGSNNIYGTFSDATFSSSLEFLDLSNNWLEGLVPRSLSRCTTLKVLNLRRNKLRDEFPHWLGNLSNVQVLDLSWNFFFGSLALSKSTSPFPQLQVLDLSNNKFSGKIPAEYIENFKAMMNITQSVRSPAYMQSHMKIMADNAYFYSITLTSKSVDRKYEKVITTLATFDISNNKFGGEIPSNIGKLVSLYGLNLSHNQLVGPIPRSLGSLTFLNFLDLSSNNLTGQIPQELTSLTSIGVFNVSENQLVGPIPHGNNFNTYSADSYNGNLGLCGFPLPDCGGHGKPRPQPSKNDNEDEDEGMMSEWKAAMMGIGFGTFVSFIWGCYMLSIGRPLWLLKLVLILVDKVEKMFGRRRRRRRIGRN